MVCAFMLGQIFREKINFLNAYGLSLWIVLLVDPLQTLSIGFWLSFGAVGVLIYGMQNRILINNLWWKLGRAQWVVFIGLLPVCLSVFNEAPLLSPVANFVAIPWVSFLVVPLALIGTVLLSFHFTTGSLFIKLSAGLLGMIWPFLEKISRSTFNIEMVNLTGWTLAFAMIGVLLLLAPKALFNRSLGFLWFLPIFFPHQKSLKAGAIEMHLLDVGQGLSVLINTQNHVLLYDTGPKFGRYNDAGKSIILPFLKHKHIKKIDTLLISHGDNDHIGGAESVLKALPVNKILTSETVKLNNYNPIVCHHGQSWRWDGVQFEILSPYQLKTGKRNNLSCVLKVSNGQQSILLTGDIEAPAETLLIKHNLKDLKSTLLIAPHHGSKTSSTQAFIDAVRAEWVIFPVGFNNRWHFPHPEVMQRYKKNHTNLLDSSIEGCVSILFERGEKDEPNTNFMRIKSFRKEHKNYWN